ncbi:peroxiredoxin [Helicobacter enhydrae]|uniref:Putative peroxiredoxin bcp n=1 Tax=Helicobacter enhydrae TaxID=222136 RepID=A0A1B1U4M0_9HELI|nr:thioredoxin-dependent thiol peroxidase [Helicobacter enhydrae]ANV97744.1 peroxiredoxin [Helicobacter enhydrae]
MKAPHFSLPNQDGMMTSLQNLLHRTLVLYFYPKDNTAGCTLEAQDFTQLIGEFDKCQTNIVGISPDSVKSHKNFIAKHDLGIMLLSDGDKSVSAQYGAFGEKKLYGKTYQGIIRSTFVIAQNGDILHSWKNVKAKNHAKEVLEWIQHHRP